MFFYNFRFLLDFLTGQLVYGLELVGKDAVEVCVKLLGDKDPLKAAPGTIRALYGTDPVRNCVHVSSSPEAAIQVVFFTIFAIVTVVNASRFFLL